MVIRFPNSDVSPPLSIKHRTLYKPNPLRPRLLFSTPLCSYSSRKIDSMPVSTQYTIQSGDDLTPERLEALNAQLAKFSPQEVLEWAIDNLPNLYQTTAFGLTGKYTNYLETGTLYSKQGINLYKISRFDYSRYDQQDQRSTSKRPHRPSHLLGYTLSLPRNIGPR